MEEHNIFKRHDLLSTIKRMQDYDNNHVFHIFIYIYMDSQTKYSILKHGFHLS